MSGSSYNELIGEVSIKTSELLESDPGITLDTLYSEVLEYFSISEDQALDVYEVVKDVYNNIN